MERIKNGEDFEPHKGRICFANATIWGCGRMSHELFHSITGHAGSACTHFAYCLFKDAPRFNILLQETSKHAISLQLSRIIDSVCNNPVIFLHFF